MLARLPHIRQLLLQLVKHGCAKEVELLCAGLMHLCTLLPPQAAQQLSAWTVDCCELDDAQAWLADFQALNRWCIKCSIPYMANLLAIINSLLRSWNILGQ